MTRILHIDSSSSLEPSTSRQVSKMVVERLLMSSGGKCTVRDLGKEPVPHICENLIEAFYKPGDLSDKAREAGQRSEQLIKELFDHDIIVMGAPMYNYTIPTTLKAYFDHIARPGFTFKFTSDGSQGLMQGKKVIAVVTRAGSLMGSPKNHQETYLETMFSFLGISNYEFIVLEGVNDSDIRKKKIVEARRLINNIEI